MQTNLQCTVKQPPDRWNGNDTQFKKKGVCAFAKTNKVCEISKTMTFVKSSMKRDFFNF